MELHIHIHHHDDDKILSEIKSINSKIDQIMTKQERFDAILSRIDTVTTNIAQDYQILIDEVKAGTVSDESLAKAEANVAKLEELAASKENPVPGENIPPADEPGNGGTGTNP
jgi:hypothetical protein